MDTTFDDKFSDFDDRFDSSSSSSDSSSDTVTEWGFSDASISRSNSVSDSSSNRDSSSDAGSSSDDQWNQYNSWLQDWDDNFQSVSTRDTTTRRGDSSEDSSESENTNQNTYDDSWRDTDSSDSGSSSSDDSGSSSSGSDTVDDSNSGSSDSGSSSSYTGSTSSVEDRTAKRLHELINQERQQRGLSPLSFSSSLAETANAKSSDMASRNYFSHTSPSGDNFRDLYNRHGVSCGAGGENIARTWYNRNVRTDSGSIVNYDSANELADGLRRQWMTSSAHRRAILRSRYDRHGLGIEITGSGRVYATEHFC